jgi:hypothetical protein
VPQRYYDELADEAFHKAQEMSRLPDIADTYTRIALGYRALARFAARQRVRSNCQTELRRPLRKEAPRRSSAKS